MADLLHHKLAFFDDYPNDPFEFIALADINILESPHYYKGIFRNIKTDEYTRVEIIPELVRYRYKVGHIYINGEMTGINPSVMYDVFNVNKESHGVLVQLSSVITDKDVQLISDSRFNHFFMKQYAHVEVQEDCTLIIPSYTIANRFYFLSGSMKEALMKGTLDDLYYKGSFTHEELPSGKIRVYLHVKKKAGRKNLPYLVRFIGNSFAKSRFKYIRASAHSKLPYQQIKAQFPIEKSFDIYTSYICIGDDERGKPKYLVLNIHSDNTTFGFQEIIYKQYSSKVKLPSAVAQQMDLPASSLRTIKRKNTKRSNKLYTGIPSNQYALYMLYTNTSYEYFSGPDIKTQEITIYKADDVNVLYEHVDKIIGTSFEPEASSGDDNLGRGIVVNDNDKKRKKDLFRLTSFYQFYEALLGYPGIVGLELEGPIEIKKVSNKSHASIKRLSVLFGDKDKARHFLFGELSYSGKSVYLVEIEHDFSWGPSTWLFISHDSSKEYTVETMQELIGSYIQNESTEEEFKKYALNNYGLLFTRKEHKIKDIDEEAIDGWCDKVTGKIQYLEKKD
ncbi:hypothetical protein [Sulfuricurvum sp.]|uniref:hypothetical protein n=1 Tax=Sulfuricurvum sp. TaxID=2025608 RepID=UPI00261B6932|nr:hypothetical protein [Sulfuricurvum sp.]MDD2781919.1 hypothetical protein [Sulfuricurvum sp.]